MEIRLEQISKQFEGFAALKPTSLVIPSGQLVALLGPSGSGKTTLLTTLALLTLGLKLWLERRHGEALAIRAGRRH